MKLDKTAIDQIIDRLEPGGADNAHGTTFDGAKAERQLNEYLLVFVDDTDRLALQIYFSQQCERVETC